MSRQESRQIKLLISFALVLGAMIALIIWSYLRVADLGVTLLWEIIPDYLGARHYTLIMCIIGGVLIGGFAHIFGSWPESMRESLNRVRESRSYPFGKLPLIVAASFIPIFFGGAIGPESGLISLLLGLSFWTMSQFGLARWKMEAYFSNHPFVSVKFVFFELLKDISLPPDKIIYDKGKIKWRRSEQIGAGAAAGVCALVIYILLSVFLGSGVKIPRMEEKELYALQRAGAIPLMAAGIAAGYVFLISRKLTKSLFAKLLKKRYKIMSAALGGLILALVGSALPMTMFSGGNAISVVKYDYLQYTPYLLILVGLLKLVLTNVCIESGWRGGHFFPIIFSGLSIGYGFAVIFDINQVYSVVLVTTALMATVVQQPIGAIVLSVIFFPVEEMGWICLAAAVGGCLPQPKALRMNPDNKGFIYSLTHRKIKNALPNRGGLGF